MTDRQLEQQEHVLDRVEWEYERGYCDDANCCPGSTTYRALCSCGEEFIGSCEGDVQWDHEQHAKEVVG